MGVPAPVHDGRVVSEPVNLGSGWVGFDFEAAFAKPTKVVNDATMQALGSYEGGRMLFLGLGTGLGSTLVVDGVVAPMELGHLPFRKATFEDYVGERGRKRLGKKKWHAAVVDAIERLTAALEPDYVVLGGGNAKKVGDLPANVRLGANDNAFVGAFRLWDPTMGANVAEHSYLRLATQSSLAADELADRVTERDRGDAVEDRGRLVITGVGECVRCVGPWAWERERSGSGELGMSALGGEHEPGLDHRDRKGWNRLPALEEGVAGHASRVLSPGGLVGAGKQRVGVDTDLIVLDLVRILERLLGVLDGSFGILAKDEASAPILYPGSRELVASAHSCVIEQARGFVRLTEVVGNCRKPCQAVAFGRGSPLLRAQALPSV